MTEEREIKITSEYGTWNRRVNLLLQLLVLLAILYSIHRLDVIYNGNPNGGGRQLLCAISKDDAEADAEVAKVVEANCPGLKTEGVTVP